MMVNRLVMEDNDLLMNEAKSTNSVSVEDCFLCSECFLQTEGKVLPLNG